MSSDPEDEIVCDVVSVAVVPHPPRPPPPHHASAELEDLVQRETGIDGKIVFLIEGCAVDRLGAQGGALAVIDLAGARAPEARGARASRGRVYQGQHIVSGRHESRLVRARQAALDIRAVTLARDAVGVPAPGTAPL